MTIRLFAVVLLGVVLTACDHYVDDPPTLPDEPTLTRVQAEVFTQGCALSGCHAGAAAPMGLDLRDGRSHAHLVGVPSMQLPAVLRVAAGNPDESYLVMKVEGAEGIVGARMPLGAPPLSASQIELIRAWIGAGALND